MDNFCDEARTARSDSRSLNVDLRVLGIGAGGGSEASTNSAFTKYCSERSNEDRDVLNYQQYLDGIDPGAYAAYDACTAAASTGVVFQLLTPTRDELHLVVSFPTNDRNARADMSWAAIGPVSCQWESFDGGGAVEAAQQRILRADERTRLKCERDSFNSEPIREPDYVNVIRDGGTATINIPWSKYNRQGEPVATLAEIQQQLEERLDGEVEELRRAMGQELDALKTALDMSIFGDWMSIAVDSTRMAETDGIVVAFSEGDGDFGLWVGERADSLLLRTHGRGPQDGTATPVKMGQYYRVATNGSAVMTAWWMPIVR